MQSVLAKRLAQPALAAFAMERGLAEESDGGCYWCWWVQEAAAASQAAYLGQCICVRAMALALLPKEGKT